MIVLVINLRPVFRAASDLLALKEVVSDLLCAKEILRRWLMTVAIVAREAKNAHASEGIKQARPSTASFFLQVTNDAGCVRGLLGVGHCTDFI